MNEGAATMHNLSAWSKDETTQRAHELALTLADHAEILRRLPVERARYLLGELVAYCERGAADFEASATQAKLASQATTLRALANRMRARLVRLNDELSAISPAPLRGHRGY